MVAKIVFGVSKLHTFADIHKKNAANICDITLINVSLHRI
jgi:hypothetical protein